MGGAEDTSSSKSESRPLTAAERQAIYNGAVGSINNTYRQSGFPSNGGSMDSQQAIFNGAAGITGGQGGIYTATGQATAAGERDGHVTFDPKTYFQAENPNIQMPTGGPDPGGINFATYQAPDYQNPGSFRAGGYTAGLDYDKTRSQQVLDSSAAKRGVWSSGLAQKQTIDNNNAYSGAYEKAGADAATAENAYNLTGAAAANAFNTDQAAKQYQSGWAPLNYLAGLWGSTAGNVGGTNSFSQGAKIGMT